MSRSILKDKYMRRCYTGQPKKSWTGDVPARNPHRLDEMPKNTPSKLVQSHCHCDLHRMLGSSTFWGHACSTGAHRQVRGLVRACLKREQRKQMLEQLAEYYEPQDHTK
jgi:hypothetical protein